MDEHDSSAIDPAAASQESEGNGQLSHVTVTPSRQRVADLISQIKDSADKLATDQTTQGDLKILSRALRERFDQHRAIARWTYPLWLYVCVTGVVIYLMLYHLFRAT